MPGNYPKLFLRQVPDTSPPQFQITNGETGQPAPPAAVESPHTFPIPDAGDATLTSEMRWYLETFLKHPFDPWTQKAERFERALKRWGTRAFKALFDNLDAGHWIPHEADAVLDFTITCDEPALLAWPWEALHFPKLGFLGHRARIQRRLSKDVPDPPELPALPKDTIRILLVTARPYENDVDYRSISRPLVDLIRDQQLPAEVHVLRPPTFDGLKAHLREHPDEYHILHFDGHGGYGLGAPENPGADGGDASIYLKGHEGRLLFEKLDGKPDDIRAETLAAGLKGCHIPYVVLNACRSGAIDEHAHQGSAFASVAGALVSAGFRGVLAMSHNLTVTGADQFLPAFYAELFQSGNLLEAARAGRLKMFERPQRSAWNPKAELQDWLLPVVYQQRDDFDLGFVSNPAPPKTERAFELPEEARIRETFTFRGRDAAIHALERRLGKKTPAILIHGLGGIGKTTLARHFLRWLHETGGLDQPPIWINFEGVQPASAGVWALNQIGRPLMGDGFDANKPEHREALTQQLLALDKPLLIVWDNFESISQLANHDGERMSTSVEAGRPETD
ncbi:MAG: hypothetical protein ACI8UO_001629, partial [Verrucomicrobiales bacterium]